MIETVTKRIPTDDRDAYPNKRVDIPGFLLADLFPQDIQQPYMVKDVKAALSKEIHGGSWKATGNWTEIVNINKIIKSTIMDVLCLKSSLIQVKLALPLQAATPELKIIKCSRLAIRR